MTVPAYHELFNSVLHAIKLLGGSASIQELNDKVVSLLDLPPEDLAIPHGDRGTELEYRLAWARTYLKSFGILDNSARGVWALTPDGEKLDSVDPLIVVRSMRSEQRDRRLKQRHDETVSPEEPPNLLAAEPVLEGGWRDQLLALLLELPPGTFERLCQRLLRESGFVRVEVTGRSGDGGIDGVGVVRIGELLGFPVLFQCKRYRGAVGAPVIRDFRGAMIGRAERGLVITTGTYSREARAEATRDGAPPIDLVDGEELLGKLKDLGLGVEVKQVEQVSVLPEWFRDL